MNILSGISETETAEVGEFAPFVCIPEAARVLGRNKFYWARKM
ncbi:protein of unknown function [Methylocaldum szegediense]|uniref:Uncharacterized protein n=1 Tax=Methylocaldum szegediense TaxID=73780 RepID=A0ABN8X976_9GAMM|nr:protein of unknown function [Methylocaldum szegediense]